MGRLPGGVVATFRSSTFRGLLCGNLGSAASFQSRAPVADVYLDGLMKPKRISERTERKAPGGAKADFAERGNQLRSYQGDYWSEEFGQVAYRWDRDGKLKLIALLDCNGTLLSTPAILPANTLEVAAADELVMNECELPFTSTGPTERCEGFYAGRGPDARSDFQPENRTGGRRPDGRGFR